LFQDKGKRASERNSIAIGNTIENEFQQKTTPGSLQELLLTEYTENIELKFGTIKLSRSETMFAVDIQNHQDGCMWNHASMP